MKKLRGSFSFTQLFCNSVLRVKYVFIYFYKRSYIYRFSWTFNFNFNFHGVRCEETADKGFPFFPRLHNRQRNTGMAGSGVPVQESEPADRKKRRVGPESRPGCKRGGGESIGQGMETSRECGPELGSCTQPRRKAGLFACPSRGTMRQIPKTASQRGC